MTETREELIDRGWKETHPFPLDIKVVARMRCTCGGHLVLTPWIKPGRHFKQFTTCQDCGHRKAF